MKQQDVYKALKRLNTPWWVNIDLEETDTPHSFYVTYTNKFTERQVKSSFSYEELDGLEAFEVDFLTNNLARNYELNKKDIEDSGDATEKSLLEIFLDESDRMHNAIRLIEISNGPQIYATMALDGTSVNIYTMGNLFLAGPRILKSDLEIYNRMKSSGALK